MLEIKNVYKTYSSKNGVTHRALENVSLKFNVMELSLHSLLHEVIAPNRSKDDNDKHNKFFDFILINSFL